IAAAEVVNVRVNNATTLATVTLQPGALVTGVFVGPNGPIAGGNMNAYDHAGVKLFTPNDATNAAGQFSIVVPTGLRTIRAVPPTGSGLIPVDRVITLTTATDLGTLTSRVGFAVSMTIVDAVSGVPVNAVQVHAFDGMTNLEIAQLQNTSTVLGAVSLQLPFGFYELHLLPAGFPTSTDGHAPRQIFGLVVTGPRNYGLVTMERGALVTGSVIGPSGPVSTADMDVLMPSGYKIWTTKDNTDAAGTFRVTIPLGTYRFTAQPPQGSGLAGKSTGLVQITGNTALPPINVQP